MEWKNDLGSLHRDEICSQCHLRCVEAIGALERGRSIAECSLGRTLYIVLSTLHPFHNQGHTHSHSAILCKSQETTENERGLKI